MSALSTHPIWITAWSQEEACRGYLGPVAPGEYEWLGPIRPRVPNFIGSDFPQPGRDRLPSHLQFPMVEYGR